MRILAIGAHPDDVELGLGGCLARHVKRGDTVNVLIFSRGEGGVPDEALTEGGQIDEEENKTLKGKLREKETKDALAFLGVKEENIKIFGLPDANIDISRGTLEEVYQQVMRLQPNIIYTHYLEDDHLDHVRTSLITLHAARKAKTIIFYESPSTRTSFSPNYFVDISKYRAKKVEALKMHKTQVKKPYMDVDVIESNARFRGVQAKVEYAEAFVVYRVVIE
ncbi:MAG: PIG-L family deacetylase [Methanomicrobia archaeon]|nr:PIG-L family deacetylase [Methanomicrobia archaeon]